MGRVYRSTRTQRIISVGMAVFGAAVFWTVYTGDIPWITYTGEVPDGPIMLFVGGIFLFTGLYGIYDPEATIPSEGSGGGDEI
jgi:hypothetical protein